MKKNCFKFLFDLSAGGASSTCSLKYIKKRGGVITWDVRL